MQIASRPRKEKHNINVWSSADKDATTSTYQKCGISSIPMFTKEDFVMIIIIFVLKIEDVYLFNRVYLFNLHRVHIFMSQKGSIYYLDQSHLRIRLKRIIIGI